MREARHSSDAALEASIEKYLLDQGSWVKSEELCRMFAVSARRLRDEGGQPGLCTRFAISRTANGGGYRHVSTATPQEWREFKYQVRKHAIKELVRVSGLNKRRYDVTQRFSLIDWERDTGQGLIPGFGLNARITE